MATDERHIEHLAGSSDLLKDLLRDIRRRVFGQQDGRQEPGGTRSQAGDVVGVNMHGIGADLVLRERDRVRRRDQRPPAADVDRRRIVADAGSQQQPRVARYFRQQTLH